MTVVYTSILSFLPIQQFWNKQISAQLAGLLQVKKKELKHFFLKDWSIPTFCFQQARVNSTWDTCKAWCSVVHWAIQYLLPNIPITGRWHSTWLYYLLYYLPRMYWAALWVCPPVTSVPHHICPLCTMRSPGGTILQQPPAKCFRSWFCTARLYWAGDYLG